MTLNFTSLMTNEIEQLLIRLMSYLVIFLSEVPIHGFCSFFYWTVLFLFIGFVLYCEYESFLGHALQTSCSTQ